MIYKEIVLKKLLRGPYSGLQRAGFCLRAGLCPPLIYLMPEVENCLFSRVFWSAKYFILANNILHQGCTTQYSWRAQKQFFAHLLAIQRAKLI